MVHGCGAARERARIFGGFFDTSQARERFSRKCTRSRPINILTTFHVRENPKVGFWRNKWAPQLRPDARLALQRTCNEYALAPLNAHILAVLPIGSVAGCRN